MIVYPAIDIKDGKCVRLQQGKFDAVTVYGDDPVAVAKSYEKDGAEFIHVVDLDGALKGNGANLNVIKQIVEAVSIPVQTGGGIRSLIDIKTRIDAGVARVIIGSAAVSDPDMVKEAVELYGNKIAVGIDAKDGFVATHGWEKVSSMDATELAKSMQSIGVATIIYTDIATDGMLQGPNLSAMAQMAAAVDLDVIASGGVSCAEDIAALLKTGVAGVIVGKALYAKRLTLAQALQAAL